MDRPMDEYDLDEESLLSSYHDPVESARAQSQSRGLQTIVTISLCALAVLMPSICFTLSAVVVRGVSLSEVPYLLFIMFFFMISPLAVVFQWESLLPACLILSMVVFVWPNSLRGKAWCAGLVLLLHGIVGGYLFYLRSSQVAFIE